MIVAIMLRIVGCCMVALGGGTCKNELLILRDWQVDINISP